MNPHALTARFREAGQEQVFAHWSRLTAAERHALAEQAAEIDLDEIDRLNRTLVQAKSGEVADWSDLEPAPFERLPECGGDSAAWEEAREAGEEALRAGRVAAFTVAGGQGTRLGYDGPKGTFRVTPVRRKPLFQVFAEKIAAAGARYGRIPPWFIMTSHANHDDTVAFFEKHRHFGLGRERVHFFRQGRMPAVDFDGRILLEAPGAIAMSPDGHGGSLRALHRSGALDRMEKDGIDTISYFQVDNPLVRCIDPAFVGWHIVRSSEMSSKAVLKAYPDEKVGMFCRRDGQLAVVEYSDMPAEMQREKRADGELRFNAGSIAIHVIDREFARRMAADGGGGLPFHRADKKIPAIDASGNPVKPDKPNGVKFEMFVFDALPFAKSPIVIETDRANDFSPVKNAEGVDSPATARDDQLRQFARWLRSAGAEVDIDGTGLPRICVEVSPLFGDDEATFLRSWRALGNQPDVRDGLYLEGR